MRSINVDELSYLQLSCSRFVIPLLQMYNL